MTDQAEGVASQQDLPRAGRLLQARPHVDDVARGEEAPRGSDPGDGLAGVDADAHRELDAPLVAQLAVEHGDLVAHFGGGPHGAQGVVLVRQRDPKTAITASPM